MYEGLSDFHLNGMLSVTYSILRISSMGISDFDPRQCKIKENA